MAKPLAVLAIPVSLVAGGWFLGAVVAPGYRSSIVLVTLWFVAVSVAAGRYGKSHPGFRVPLRATMATCSVLALAAFYWTSIRETTVDETLVTGTPASRLAPAEQPAVDPLAPQP